MADERRFGRIHCEVCGISYIGDLAVVDPCPNAANHKPRELVTPKPA